MHYIFLVHGMGNWDGGWSGDAKEIIQRHYDKSRYAFLGSQWPFKNHFQLEEVNYNALFEKYLDEAKKQADKLKQWNKLGGVLEEGLLGVLSRIVELAKIPPNKENFVVSHLADVALFMATDLGEQVKNEVASAIVDRLQAVNFRKANGDRWSIIAHSLGTRVMTEVLQVGFMAQPSLRNFGKAQVLMMVSNVSRLLQGIPPTNVAGNVYHNAVFPSSDVVGVCEHYINLGHRLDPFSFVREFDPPADFGDGHAFAENLYHPVKLAMADVTSKEIHSLEHYLEHPKAHTTLFRYLLSASGTQRPTDKEMEEAMEAYRLNALSAPVSDAWREAIEKLKLPEGDDAGKALFTRIFELWEKYGELLKK
jgi:hypothetical protein